MLAMTADRHTILVVDDYADALNGTSRILSRELLYTAVTRAERRLLVAGSAEALAAAVNRPVARASGLGERLWGAAAH